MTSFHKMQRHRHSKKNEKSDEFFNEANSSYLRKRPKINDSHLDKESPIYKAFCGFQQELDNRNDRYERIVKLSRDITIESKRIIFLLQRASGSNEAEKILEEAHAKIMDLNQTKFLELAKELQGQDFYQYLRAYSPGLQEYIEAVTFYHYLNAGVLVGLDHLQSDLVYTNLEKKSPANLSVSNLSMTCSDEPKSLNVSGNQQSHFLEDKICVLVSPSEYMLGVADFTGELMRMAINSVGAGDLEKPNIVACMMRVIHDAFTTFANSPRELYQKTRVLRQSLQKVETACYTLKVRGSEIPKHMLTDVFTITALGHSDTLDELTDIYDI